MDNNRREMFRAIVCSGLAVAAAKLPALPKIREIKEWVKLPEFYNGKIMSAEDMVCLTESIAQLQAEVELLRANAETFTTPLTK